jgi:hypothetical protein
VIVLVGLPDAAVRDRKDRVTTAIANSDIKRTNGRANCSNYQAVSDAG